ncbi:MAG: HAD family hydrolase [Sarcina sp.]
MLRYKCLVLDHDDTVVKSTPSIHYPSFQDTLTKIRPDVTMTMDEFTTHCFEPGFHSLCMEILNFSEEEMTFQLENWNEHVSKTIPEYYEGFDRIIKRYKELGGIIAVVSHSMEKNILRDYKANFSIEPDIIFGWDLDAEKRKPSLYPLKEIMRKYNLKPTELIMVDDLKPGFDMAKGCEVDFVCAGWSNDIEKIESFMRNNCDYYFNKVEELEELLFIK